MEKLYVRNQQFFLLGVHVKFTNFNEILVNKCVHSLDAHIFKMFF